MSREDTIRHAAVPRGRRLPGAVVALLALTASAWIAYFALLAIASESATGIGAGLGAAAFVLGIRHGLDADHIAAIDGVTRRLASMDRPSASVGLWFALGHSTVVFAAALLLGAGVRSVVSDGTHFGQFTSVWGPAFSGIFLLAISALNARTLIRMRRTQGRATANAPERGRHRRIGGITRPRQMYPVGLLFGLGFDTASSVALLVMASLAASADPAVLAGAVICLPLLFAAGMSLVDTVDSAVMARAYSWSGRRPGGRLRYDLIVTGTTLLVGVGVGVMQLTNAIGAAAGPSLALVTAVEQIDSSALGVVAVASVLASAAVGWALSRTTPT